MMFWVMLAGWLFTSIPILSGQGVGELNRLTQNGWLNLAFLGVFCSGLAYIAWYDALQSLSAAGTGVFLYIEPLVTMVVAAIVLAEPITGASLAGGAIILIGVYLVNRV
jgi:drug/metabolite transporter (DMT)-like permease